MFWSFLLFLVRRCRCGRHNEKHRINIQHSQNILKLGDARHNSDTQWRCLYTPTAYLWRSAYSPYTDGPNDINKTSATLHFLVTVLHVTHGLRSLTPRTETIRPIGLPNQLCMAYIIVSGHGPACMRTTMDMTPAGWGSRSVVSAYDKGLHVDQKVPSIAAIGPVRSGPDIGPAILLNN